MALRTPKFIVRLFEDAIVSCPHQDSIEWPNMTVRRLAAFLALNQGVRFTRKEVSDALWSEGRYRSNSLSVALYQMRHSLEDSEVEAGQIIKSDRVGMEVNDSGVEVDWLRFLDEVSSAEAEESSEAALKAISGVTGPLLHEISDGWALQAKEHFDQKIEWCLEFIGRSLPTDQLSAATEEMARIVALCAHSTDCGNRLAVQLEARDVSAARRFATAAHRLGIPLSQPSSASGEASDSHHLGVLLLVEGADFSMLDESEKGLSPGMNLPSNAKAFRDPSSAMAAAEKVTEVHPQSKILVSVEVFASSHDVPPGAWAVMKQMRGPGIHIDSTTPLRRSRLSHRRHHSKGARPDSSRISG